MVNDVDRPEPEVTDDLGFAAPATASAALTMPPALNGHRWRSRHSRSAAALLLLTALGWWQAVTIQAQTEAPDLAIATLEELMNIEISSASRKEQRADDVPAAVFVITRDDIRRSGMTSVPDLLRLAPGVQVAQINSNKWAVSVRGFNKLYSNKLLVLVDGRSVYNPLFSSVLWDTEDLLLEDVERIEVIRGPGAAVWGANAVNGVINIMTRPSADTPGLLVRGDAGTFDRASLAIRYGGTIGSGTYRSYAQFSNHGDSAALDGGDADDHWHSVTAGLRGDWRAGAEAFMLEAGGSVGEQRPLWADLSPRPTALTSDDLVSATDTAHALGRWTHTRPSGASFELQSFVDGEHRRESVGEYGRLTLDLDAIYHGTKGRHDFVSGGGYRYIGERIDGGPGYSFNPDRTRTTLLSAFAQDEIAMIGRRVTMTLGAKVQEETGNGASLQPTARVMWRLPQQQHLWAAVSRALRTPSLVDRAVLVDFLPVVAPGSPWPVDTSLSGNPAVENERLVSSELGYRSDIGTRASIDVAGFFGHYSRLQTVEPSAPTLVLIDGQPLLDVSTVFQNLLRADTRGIEITGRVMLTTAWQVDATFSAFHLTPHLDPASRDADAALFDGSAPGSQWSGHSAWSLGRRIDADVRFFYVGPLARLNVAAYTRADARVEWTLKPQLSLTVVAQNLFTAEHREFASDQTLFATQVPRSGSLRLTWRH